jgi:hypothetical protein
MRTLIDRLTQWCTAQSHLERLYGVAQEEARVAYCQYGKWQNPQSPFLP